MSVSQSLQQLGVDQAEPGLQHGPVAGGEVLGQLSTASSGSLEGSWIRGHSRLQNSVELLNVDTGINFFYNKFNF